MSGIHNALDHLLAVEKRNTILKFAAAITIFSAVFGFFGVLTTTAKISLQIVPVTATTLVEGKYSRYSKVWAEVDGVQRLMVAPVEHAMLAPGDLVCVRRADQIIGYSRYSVTSDIFCPQLHRK